MSTDAPLPARHRGVAAQRFAAAAAQGRFELPVCEDCGSVQYPLREVCVRCTSDRLAWRAATPGGVLLSGGVLLACGELHHSNDPWFRPRLPLRFGSVKLDAGPVAIALLAADCGEAGSRVRVKVHVDERGEAVLVAAAEDGAA